MAKKSGVIELSIKIRDEHSSLVEKELVYDSLLLDHNNSFLEERVQSAVVKFGKDSQLEAPEIVIKTKMVWQ